MFQFIIGFVVNVQQKKKKEEGKMNLWYSFRDSFYARATSKFILDKLRLCSFRHKCSCFWTSQNNKKKCRAV